MNNPQKTQLNTILPHSQNGKNTAKTQLCLFAMREGGSHSSFQLHVSASIVQCHVAARRTPAYHNNRIPYAVKYQSYAPEDGQKIARNMLS